MDKELMVAMFWFGYLSSIAAAPFTITYPVAVVAYLRILLAVYISSR